MRARPFDKRLLIHKVEWTPKRLTTNPEPKIIDKVRLGWKAFWQPISSQQQTVGGNWILFWVPEQSTMEDKDGSNKTYDMPAWCIGDTINFISAPLYPKLCTITNVTPFWDVDGKHIHHCELTLV